MIFDKQLESKGPGQYSTSSYQPIKWAYCLCKKIKCVSQ